MSFRLKAFALHLAGSFALLALAFGALYLGWYQWPAWYLLGAQAVIGLIVLVDLGLGPLATLVVANPAKPRAELIRDIGLIAAIQIAALVYGLATLWQGRPMFYALTKNQVELVTASDFDEQSLEQAHQKGATVLPSLTAAPQWIWARMPDDVEQQIAIVTSTLMTGQGIATMPEHFRSWHEGLPALREQLRPLPSLIGKHGLNQPDYAKLLARLGGDEAAHGWLKLQGPRQEGVMVFERAHGQPKVFLAITPKSRPKQ
ncbi:MAG: hypothetical protein ACOZAQ_10715 [Pseudomonadota bacterium]